MTIRFRCDQCEKLLSVPAEAAGKKAKCPSCENIVRIPAPEPASPAIDAPPPLDSSPSEGYELSDPPPVSNEGLFDDLDFESHSVPENPFQPPGDHSPHLGESLSSSAAETATLDLGDVFRRGWAAYTHQWGICIGTAFVVWLLSFAFAFCFAAVAGALDAGMDTGGLIFVMLLPYMVFALWLNIGQALVYLGVARGAPVSIGVLFSGGRFMLSIFLASILLTIGFYLGLVLLVIPGFFFVLVFSQCFFLILDRNLGVIDAFKESMRITRGNRLTLLAIMILLMLISLPSIIPILGMFYSLACYPFMFVVLAVAYLRMTRQRVAN